MIPATLVAGRDEAFHRFLGEGDAEPRPTGCVVVDEAPDEELQPLVDESSRNGSAQQNAVRNSAGRNTQFRALVLVVVPTPLRRFIGFPDPVNEVSARLVAAGVVTMAVAAIVLDWRWVTGALAYGFVARVMTGPKASPLGQFVTRVVTPRLPFAPKLVPGPPKRFAQGIGVAFSVTALGLTVLGEWSAAQAVLGALAGAAFLEAAFALCLGCRAFAVLMRVGVIPKSVCERCADVWGTASVTGL